MNPLIARLAAAALGAGLLLGTPAVAVAAPDRPPADRPDRPVVDPEAYRSRCAAAIDKRLGALTAASSKLAEAKHVTDAHEAALAATLSDTSAALTELAADIAGGQDPASLREQCRSVFTDHRVFGLILPRTRLVVASDVAGAAGGRLSEVADRLESALDRAEAEGHDVGGAREALATMRQEIAAAEAAAASVPDSVMDLTPADWNADHSVLGPAREAMRSARTELSDARDVARRIHAGLRSERGAAPASDV